MPNDQSPHSLFGTLLRDRYPCATAELEMPDMRGQVRFFKTPLGTLVATELYGVTALPKTLNLCIANSKKISPASLSPLSEDRNRLCYAGITDRYHVEDIMGKTVEIHVGEAAGKTHGLPITARGTVHWAAEA